MTMGEVETAELRRLALLWRELNDTHFGGQLRQPAIRLVDLPNPPDGFVFGRFTASGVGVIELDRRSWMERDGTLLHEMVHQFQHHTGRPLDHDADFREVAAAVGLPPHAGWWSEVVVTQEAVSESREGAWRLSSPPAPARSGRGPREVGDDRSPSERERRESLIEQARLRRAQAVARRPRRSLPKKGGR